MLRFPPKKILVPFDQTEPSLAAWNQALKLAERFGASAEALYVAWALAEPRRRRLEDIRSKIGGRAAISFLRGDPDKVICRFARRRKFDLIVMGTHGRSGISRALLGSLTESVVRLSPVPVLAVRGAPRPIRSVLAPVNFTNYAEHALAFAAGVAMSLKVPLTVLHVGASQDCLGSKSRLKEILARLPEKVRAGCAPALIIRHGRPTEQILRAAQDYDLLVLAAHRKSLLGDIVLGTTAERVIRHARASVLSVPPLKTAFNWNLWLRKFPKSSLSTPIL